MDVPIAANVLGTLGAICWSVQLLPQIVINYRRHSTEGLQRSMMLLWALAGIPLGVYNIVSGFNVALLIQPQILTVLSLITWCQCYYYDSNWSRTKCIIAGTMTGFLLGGVETALIFALRAGVKDGTRWPVTLMGVLSTVLLSAGVLRHYYDIYIYRTVRGISFIFVGIDAAGDVFSLVSVFFQPTLDVLGMVIYATEFALWCGVFACGGYFNLLPWIRQKRSHLQTEQQVPAIQLQANSVAVANDVDLQRMPSATSVFRTPSSLLSGRASTRS